jgi:ADP-heptose:LPS heptosyltransferase
MKILIIRFSSIGDIVLTTPLLRCIKQQLPTATLHYITKEAFSEALGNNPYIDRIYTFSKSPSECLDELKKEKYDLIIDLQKNLRSFKLRVLLGRTSTTFPKLNVRKWLMVNLKLNYLPDIHIVERYFKATKKLGIHYDGKGLDFFINKEAEKAISIIPEDYQKGFFSISCGSRHITKQIPESLIVSLIKLSHLPFVLLGGNEDIEMGDRIVKECGKRAFNACGKLNLNGSAFLITKSHALITADTGLMHIGAALKKKVVSVWGNTIPEFGMYPLMPKGMEELAEIVELKEIRCRPCSKLGHPKCPKKHFNCMKLQDASKILKLALSEKITT